MNLGLILLFCFLGSIGSVGFAGLLLVLRKDRLVPLTSALIPYAIGTLLGAAFIGIIPHALDRLPSHSVLLTVLAGIVLFFLLEKFTLWRHCHEPTCDVHSPAGDLILIGDSLHNFVDGVAIAAAFAGSVPLGIATSLAVIVHEIPQEVGDFAILLQSGYSRTRALVFNLLSSATSFLGAILTYYLLPFAQGVVPYLLALSAASFIYIALADLVPGRRSTGAGLWSVARETLLIGSGVATIVLLHAGH